MEKRKLSHAEKSVWLALGDIARDDDGIENARAYPSVFTLSWKTGLSERHVKRMLQKLRDRGAIVETQTYDPETPRTYKIVLDAVPIDGRSLGKKKNPGVTRYPVGVTPCHPRDSSKGVTACPPRGDKLSPNPPLNHHL
jgi:hypothetical protein